jgi:putative hydrolase of the HAD superfamily
MRIKAVAFDIDGTLYPDYKMFLASIMLGARYPRFINNFRIVRKQIRQYGKVDDFYKLQASLLARRMHITDKKAERLIDEVIYRKWPMVFKYVKPYHGVKDLLIKLKRMGMKIAVLSDLPVQRKLENMEVAGLWDCAFSSEETGYLKPHPMPFRELLRRLDTPAEATLYVGNNYRYDIIGASQVGIKTAHLSHKPVKGSVADLTFKFYHDLERFLLAKLPQQQF